MYQVTCAGCGKPFTAKTARAKWHDAACRKRTQRAAAQAAAKEPTRARTPRKGAAAKRTSRVVDRPERTDRTDRHGLVISTRRALEEAGKFDTFAGQLALQLARKLANPDESGVSSLSKELRTVMDTVVGGGTSAGREEGAGKSGDAEPDDEVTRARAARDQARQAARRS